MLFLETRLFVVVAQDNLCANGLFLNAAVVVVLAAVVVVVVAAVVVVRQISKAGQNLFKFWITDSFPFYLVSFLDVLEGYVLRNSLWEGGHHSHLILTGF